MSFYELLEGKRQMKVCESVIWILLYALWHLKDYGRELKMVSDTEVHCKQSEMHTYILS